MEMVQNLIRNLSAKREIAILQLSYETSIEFPGVIYRWKQRTI